MTPSAAKIFILRVSIQHATGYKFGMSAMDLRDTAEEVFSYVFDWGTLIFPPGVAQLIELGGVIAVLVKRGVNGERDPDDVPWNFMDKSYGDIWGAQHISIQTVPGTFGASWQSDDFAPEATHDQPIRFIVDQGQELDINFRKFFVDGDEILAHFRIEHVSGLPLQAMRYGRIIDEYNSASGEKLGSTTVWRKIDWSATDPALRLGWEGVKNAHYSFYTRGMELLDLEQGSYAHINVAEAWRQATHPATSHRQYDYLSRNMHPWAELKLVAYNAIGERIWEKGGLRVNAHDGFSGSHPMP